MNVDVVKNRGLFFIYIFVVMLVISIVIKIVMLFVRGIILVWCFCVDGWLIKLNWCVKGVMIIKRIRVMKNVVKSGINCK